MVAVMLVASLTMFASTQNIVGKWRVDTEAMIAGTETEGIKFDITYAEDKSGTMNIGIDIYGILHPFVPQNLLGNSSLTRPIWTSNNNQDGFMITYHCCTSN